MGKRQAKRIGSEHRTTRRRADETTRDEGRKPLNKAYFEVLTTSFARLSVADENCLVARKELLKDNLMYLMNIPAFETAISTGTGILDRVQTRFKGVADAIRATLEGRKLGAEKC